MTNLQQLTKLLAQSIIFKRGRKLWVLNQGNWNLRLSKIDNLITCIYLILDDYSQGRFPPHFDDQQKTYNAEIAYRFSLSGIDYDKIADIEMRKPFWFGVSSKIYFNGFIELVTTFEDLGVYPPQKLLELGCGTGWMAEFLAVMGFNVVGTSISLSDIKDAQRRIDSIRAKNFKVGLDFMVAPMETVAETTKAIGPFDAVYVFEALHHAYDWRKTIVSSFACLRDGGWFILCSEPNIIHTITAYRVGKLSNTHEIGLSRGQLVKQLKQTGFNKIRILKNRIDTLRGSHWIAAQK